MENRREKLKENGKNIKNFSSFEKGNKSESEYDTDLESFSDIIEKLIFYMYFVLRLDGFCY